MGSEAMHKMRPPKLPIDFLSSHYLPIDLQHFERSALPTEFLGVLAPRSAHPLAHTSVEEHFLDTTRDVENVLRAHQHRRIADYFGQGARRRCDHRGPRRHRLQRRQSEALIERGKDK